MYIPFAAVLLSASVVSGLVAPRAKTPKGWPNVLEDYNGYHIRYLALGCQNKHNTQFFHLCCHPLLKTQSLAQRPAQCTPQSDEDADDDDSDCEDGDDDDIETVTVSPTSTVTTKATPTKAPSTTKKTTTPHVSTTSTAPTPQKSSTTSDVFTDGFATFFFQRGNRGACGELHSDNDLIAAIDEQRYGSSSRKSSLCGKKVKITNPENGKSVTVTIVDDCPSCVNRNSIDLSVAAFKAIAKESEGMVKIHWSFL